MTNNRIAIIAIAALALGSMTACSDEPSDTATTEAPAQQAITPATSTATAAATNTAPTGDILANVEDPSLDPSMAPATGAAGSGGSVSAFKKSSAMNPGSAGDISVQDYRQQAQDVASANRRMEEGVNRAAGQ